MARRTPHPLVVSAAVSFLIAATACHRKERMPLDVSTSIWIKRNKLEWKLHWLFRLALFVSSSAVVPLVCSRNKPGCLLRDIRHPDSWA
jgi:hypothetical protein